MTFKIGDKVKTTIEMDDENMQGKLPAGSEGEVTGIASGDAEVFNVKIDAHGNIRPLSKDKIEKVINCEELCNEEVSNEGK